MNTQPTTKHPRPSAQACDLVRGAYDLQVHTGPDLMPRSASDLELAERCRQRGLAGFVIKSHYIPTAARAALVHSLMPDIHALGSITLNSAIGGMNTMAVEIAARAGARIVWMPTFDTFNEMYGPQARLPLEKRPQWARLQQELREQGVKSEPIRVLDEEQNVLPEVRSVLRTIAAHNLVLATGHLDRNEIFAVVDAALAEGVRQIIVTHPEYPAQNLSVEDQLTLAQRGAFLEHCFTTPYTGKISWEQMCANIRATGPEHSFLSTDLGQPTNPPIEDGLPLMVDQLLAAAFSEEEIITMAVTNTVRLATGGETS